MHRYVWSAVALVAVVVVLLAPAARQAGRAPVLAWSPATGGGFGLGHAGGGAVGVVGVHDHGRRVHGPEPGPEPGAGILVCNPPAVYRPRHPEAQVFYQVFEQHFDSYVRAYEAASGLHTI